MSEVPPEFLHHCALIPDYASLNLSEADTRAYLVDPVLRVLGYSGVNDLRREVPVPATKESLDYELYANGKAQVIVEAKALRHSVSDQAAAQCVQYAAVLGDQWCIITNGIVWAIYNAHARGPLADKRVATIRLDGTEGDWARSWGVLGLFSRQSLADSNPLTTLLADRVVVDELSKPDSPAINALRKAITERFGERVSGAIVVEAVARWRAESLSSTAIPTSLPNPTKSALPKRGPIGGGVRSPQSVGQVADLVAAGLLPPDAVIEAHTRRGQYRAQLVPFQVRGRGERLGKVTGREPLCGSPTVGVAGADAG